LDAVTARGFQPETVAMDKGYDNTRVYAEVEERGADPVIPLRTGRGRAGEAGA
jgi:IS5 family transposase